MKRPELLSPAGSAPAMVAAVQNGADAVYLGAGEFNARKSAENFGGELDAAVAYCHARDARVYVTLNTMIRQDEVRRMEKTICEIAEAGADGVIVQDLGTVRMLREIAPGLHLHASTQMAVHNPQGVEYLVSQGFTRVVLARELTYKEIEHCSGLGAELEVFVHGALCVSCSGQCLLSSMIGGRSGNRGMCAQPCRMRYSMDGTEGHMLSTRDLFGMEGLKELLEAGADSLKIEGRLKRPEYVAVTTAAYRCAVDDLLAEKTPDINGSRAELSQMFNRGGFTRGYGFGVQDTELMFRERPNHIGIPVGKCRKNGIIASEAELDASDVLVLRRNGSDDIPVHIKEAAASVAVPAAKPGDTLVRLVSARQMADAQASFAGEHKLFPIRAELKMRVGEPVSLCLSDGVHTVTETGEAVQVARTKSADPERIRAQIEKLGDTPFSIDAYSADIDTNAFLPVSALNALRRNAAEKLLASRFGASVETHAMGEIRVAPTAKRTPVIVVQSSDPEVLCRAEKCGAGRTAFMPCDVRSDALDRAADLLPEAFDLVLPPVMTGETLRVLHGWAERNSGRILRTMRSNISQFDYSWPGEAAADYQMNIANDVSVSELERMGVSLYTPSVELNRSQITAMGGNKQLIVYGRLPLMLLRHCPLRAAKGLKGPHNACRRCDSADGCDRIDAKALTDRTGAAFPLRRIASGDGCVIQLLNSAPLMLLRKSASLPTCGEWRLLVEGDDPVEELVRLHRAAAQGEDVRLDEALNQFTNTTTGHYFRGAE